VRLQAAPTLAGRKRSPQVGGLGGRRRVWVQEARAAASRTYAGWAKAFPPGWGARGAAARSDAAGLTRLWQSGRTPDLPAKVAEILGVSPGETEALLRQAGEG